MMNVQSSAGLKRMARGTLLGKYRSTVVIVLAVSFFNNFLLSFNSVNVIGTTVFGILLQYLISLGILLFGGILTVGANAFYLNIACKRTYSFQDLFVGFRLYPEKALGIQFFLWILRTIPLLPAYGFSFSTLFRFGAEGLLARLRILLPLYLAGWLIGLFLMAMYSQCFYLLLDFPEMSLRQLLRSSRRLMKGQIFRYLYTQISFLPLTLAAVISFGIGYLFLSPYRDMTFSLFYLDLIQTKRYNEHQE